jgi:hypothetical protein
VYGEFASFEAANVKLKSAIDDMCEMMNTSRRPGQHLWRPKLARELLAAAQVFLAGVTGVGFT